MLVDGVAFGTIRGLAQSERCIVAADRVGHHIHRGAFVPLYARVGLGRLGVCVGRCCGGSGDGWSQCRVYFKSCVKVA